MNQFPTGQKSVSGQLIHFIFGFLFKFVALNESAWYTTVRYLAISYELMAK